MADCSVPLALPALALGLLTPAALGQSVLYTFDGDSQADFFGSSVRGAGDVDGDGVADLIVGSPGDDDNGSSSGSARVFSGADGSILYTFYGDSEYDFFGGSVSGAGDVNGDGFDDVIVGAIGDDNNGGGSGSARVFSGLDGSILYAFDGDSGGDFFGDSVSGAGDVDGDGYADLIVGADRDDNNGLDTGSARVFSGVDGSILYTFNGDSTDDRFGESVSGPGDVNGDGYDDLIVGADVDDNHGDASGSARVFSGLDGSTLYTFDGDSAGDLFGHSVSRAGDVNGDGFDDLIVGAPRDGNNGPDSGSARVLSGMDGSVLYTFDGDSPGDWFGITVSGAGDVNGDGSPDLIVGASQSSNHVLHSGSARVFSGLDGSPLYTFEGNSEHDHLGGSVSGFGDVNGDGFADLIVSRSGSSSEEVHVFSGCDALGTSYCSAVPNSSGQPAGISACGSVRANGGYFMLHVKDLPVDQFGYFLASETQGFVANPGGSQGNLCLAGSIGRFVQQVRFSGAGGSFSLDVDLTDMPPPLNSPVGAGQTWNFQAWYRDVNPTPTSNFTDAVSVTFH